MFCVTTVTYKCLLEGYSIGAKLYILDILDAALFVHVKGGLCFEPKRPRLKHKAVTLRMAVVLQVFLVQKHLSQCY